MNYRRINILKSCIEYLKAWRIQHITERRFILILSLVVGIASGFAAFLLKSATFYIHDFLTAHFNRQGGNFLYLVYPVVGIMLVFLFVKYFIKDNLGHGVSRILYAISRKRSYLRQHHTYSSIVASSITIASGGSVGAEAPVVLTGSAIGSNIGRLFRLDYKQITLLIGCGAAGAIAGIFKAPVAGIVFTLEVLMLDLTMSLLIPLLISAASGATIAYLLMGDKVVFSFTVVEPFSIGNLPFYLILGIICGAISVYFTRGSMWVEKVYGKIKNPLLRSLSGGIILSLLIYFFPSLYGEGYDTLKAILSGNGTILLDNSMFYDLKSQFSLFILMMAFILFFKVIAMSSTTSAGGVGGVFAPSLFMGGITGYMVALLLKHAGFLYITENNFALVGMAGVMAGVMHAPLTAIFLIAEITGGYNLFVPLIVVSTISFLVIGYFEPHSVYHKKLAERGELLTHDKDKTVLTLMRCGHVIENDLITIGPDKTLRDLVKIVSQSKRNIFPVIDEENVLYGIILLDDIREIMFQRDSYDKVKASELMVSPLATIHSHESMDSVMEKFERTGSWNLPVVDNGKYMGFVSKSKIFNSYREILRYVSEA